MAMLCPNCRRRIHENIVRCSSCHTGFPNAPLEELGHLAYLHARLDGWERQGTLAQVTVDRLMAIIAPEGDRLERLLLGNPSSNAAVASAPLAIAAPRRPVRETNARRELLIEAMPRPALEPIRTPATVRFSWSQLGASLLSERTLNALLTLGAMLILASAMVIATVNPTHLDRWRHLAALLLTTAVFSGSGYAVRQKLRLPMAGGALLLIAAALLPFDIWTVSQPTLLNWPPVTAWLFASLVCAPVYFAFHAALGDRPSAVLTTLAGGSILLALLTALGVPTAWGCAGLAILAGGYLSLAHLLVNRRASLSWALLWTAQVTMPAVILALTVAGFAPVVWAAALGQAPGALIDYAVGLAWWIGVGFYALSGRLFGMRAFVSIAGWMLPAAFLLTLTKAPWDAAWYAPYLALLAAGYAAFACWPWRSRTSPTWRALLSLPASQVALALSIVSALWPLQRPESAVPTLLILAVTQGAVAIAVRREACAYLASALLTSALAVALPLAGLSAGIQPIIWTLFAMSNVATGFLVRRRESIFSVPLLVTGYLLSMTALLSSLASSTTDIAVTGLCLGLYALAARVWSHQVWRYLVALLMPLLLGQTLAHLLLSVLLGPAFIALGLGYSLLALRMREHAVVVSPRSEPTHADSSAEPFARAGQLLNVLGFLLVAPERKSLIMAATVLTALHYGLLAWRSRRRRYAYPLAAALAVMYAVALAQLAGVARLDYGLAILPGCAAALLLTAWLRRLDARPFGWATPFLTIMLLGMAASVALTLPEPAPRALALAGVTALLGVCCRVFRHPAWLYPTIVAALSAYLTTIAAAMPNLTVPTLAATLVVPTWLLGGSAYTLDRLASRLAPTSPWTTLAATPQHRWAAPLCASGTVALLCALAGSVTDATAGVVVAASSFILLAILASLWQSTSYVWAALASAAQTLGQGLRLAGVPVPEWAALFTGALFAGSLLALGLDRRPGNLAKLWAKPLASATLWASAVPVLAAASMAVVESTGATQAMVVTLALSALALVTHAYRSRQRVLCYGGVGLIVLSFLVELSVYSVAQPQAYALPVGIYLLAITYQEWRRDHSSRAKGVLELTGIGVLLGVTLVQVLNQLGMGPQDHLDGTLLITESLVVFGLGATLRWKRAFFTGCAGVLSGLLTLMVNPLHTVNTWYLLTAIGCGMVAMVVLIERQRQRIPLWFDDWHSRLELWN